MGGLPPEPTSITDFEVPECFRNVVVGGEQKTFLLHDDLEEAGLSTFKASTFQRCHNLIKSRPRGKYGSHRIE